MTSDVFRDCFPFLLGNSIMDEMGLELMACLPAEHNRRTRSTDPIGYDEDVVTVVDPKDVWREDIVDVVKQQKPPSKNKAVAVTADPKEKATKTDLKKPAKKRDILSKKKAVTAMTDPKKTATKTDLKKPAKKRDHQEISAPGLDSTTATTSTITTVPALMNGGNGNGGDDVTIHDEGNGDNSDYDDDTFEDNDGDSDDTCTDDDGDPQSQSSGDTAIHRVMKEAKVESFKDLDDVKNVIIDAYECLTGNRLRIEKSQKDKYRVYQCYR